MSFSSLKLSPREQISILVEEFNESRLELFHLSQPTEELEIRGVMRFYFQDCGDRVFSKCIRVCSNATTKSVIKVLTEKFLCHDTDSSVEDYSLWEVHENGQENCLGNSDKPLIRQLYWFRDDRDGRFFIRRSFIQEEKLSEVPLKAFTRTLTNPEVVMKRRREQKLKEKLMEITSGASGLKIFGGGLVPSRPYVTLLVRNSDSASDILEAAIEKYGLAGEESDFVLVEVQLESDKTIRALQPFEFPLRSMTTTQQTYFAIRRALPAYREVTSILEDSIGSQYNAVNPALAVSQPDGSICNPPQYLLIRPGITEVGSDKAMQDYSQQTQNIYIEDPNVAGRHCSLYFEDDIVTITPGDYNPPVYVNNVRISETEMLKNGDVVIIGRTSAFMFVTDTERSQEL